MASFIYQARTIAGKVVKGRIDARDETDARIKLRARQLIPVSFEVVISNQKENSLEEVIKRALAGNLKTKDLQIFTRQFATLINAGIPIADALKIMTESSTNQILKDALIQISASIDSGRRLSESMMKHPRIFDRLYCNLIQAGEEAGIIDTILTRLAVYIEKNQKIKNQVRSALTMPGLILIVAIVVINGIIMFIIPKFQEIYAGSGKELPWLTQTIVNLSEMMRSHWLIIFLVFFGAIFAVVYYVKTPEGSRNYDKFIINAPIFGSVVQRASVARMSRTLSTLLSSGVGLIESIEIASKTSGNYIIEKALADCKAAVTQGKAFHLPLARQKEIPIMVSQMVAIGEQTGSIDSMLAKIADFYEDEVENAVKAMTSLIEPLMMVVLGSAIAIILIAMYLPIFNLGETIG